MESIHFFYLRILVYLSANRTSLITKKHQLSLLPKSSHTWDFATKETIAQLFHVIV